MRIMISGATKTLREYIPGNEDILGVLLTPDTGNSIESTLATGLPWAIDNAAWNRKDDPMWRRRPDVDMDLQVWFSDLGHVPRCMFAAVPDVPCEGAPTYRLWYEWAKHIEILGLPPALVIQDGMEDMELPWDDSCCCALFVGGSVGWKLSAAARDLVFEAKRRGMWVHMGKVNTYERLAYAYQIGCDSVDGSGWSKWSDQRIPLGVNWMRQIIADSDQPTMYEEFERKVPPLQKKLWLDGKWIPAPPEQEDLFATEKPDMKSARNRCLYRKPGSEWPEKKEDRLTLEVWGDDTVAQIRGFCRRVGIECKAEFYYHECDDDSCNRKQHNKDHGTNHWMVTVSGRYAQVVREWIESVDHDEPWDSEMFPDEQFLGEWHWRKQSESA